MTSLTKAVHDYIELRRTLGYKMCTAKILLLQFAAFMDQHQADYVTQALALIWAQQTAKANPSYWVQRLTVVRGFSYYRLGTDPRTEIPQPGLLAATPNRSKPHLYSDREVQSLLEAARTMPYRGKRRALLPKVYATLFGLLSVSGLRLSEARDLALTDIDLEARMLTVRHAKYGRERLVALHPTTVTALADYIECRRHHFIGRLCADNLFVSSKGTVLLNDTIQAVFRKLSRQIGLRGVNDIRGPRLHDFRHTFAVRTLENWYQKGQDPERLLPILSTHLGHVSISDTYWYLENNPNLMQQAVRRLETRWEGEQ